MGNRFSKIFVLSFLLGLFVFPSSAAVINTVDDVLTNTNAHDFWEMEFSDWESLDYLDDFTSSSAWGVMDKGIAVTGYGRAESLDQLSRAATAFNVIADSPVNGFGKWAFLMTHGRMPHAVVRQVNTIDGAPFVLLDERTGIPIVNSNGLYPYFIPSDSGTGEETTDRTFGGKWVRIDKVNWSRVNILSEYSFYDIGYALRDAGEDNEVDVRHVDGKPTYEYLVSRERYENGIPFVYCDTDGNPYVNRPDADEWAQEDDNDYFVDDDGDNIFDDGDTISDKLIDLDSNTVWFPNGTLQYINNLVYDESTKTYYVDAHQEYDLDTNTYITNNYHYEYHINYTSVTYIGQTEEYDEKYEFYYQLPDGRSSADLTAEELQALNTQIDVLPYIRSADDTSIRALYHFDGNTRDSSYWSHLGNFKWNSGATLTYMDVGAFNGALYLDENAHDFTVTLPSNIGSNDFTVQFRYYQSHTLAPAEDAYLAFSGVRFLRANGESWMNSLGNVISPISVGNWNEICLMRRNGVLHYFVNGVCVNQLNSTRVLGNTLQFVFGSEQQTYKYFDELRVVNKALYTSEGYDPTSVPFDTNLTLVLPDGTQPVADEYWSIQSDLTNLFTAPGYDTWAGETLPTFAVGSSTIESANSGAYWTGSVLYPSAAVYPKFGYHSSLTAVNSYDHSMSIVGKNFKDASGYAVPERIAKINYSNPYYVPTHGIHMRLGGNPSSNLNLPSGDYTVSMVDMDGNVGSLTFTVPASVPSSSESLASLSFNGYCMEVYTLRYSSSTYYLYLSIRPEELGVENEFAYLQLVEGTSTDLTAEWVESVVAMDKDDLNTPSLAVRTDLDITGYQIGGVRPSLPTKGLVWALVESGRINSLQIYDGQAWESVDGRIWTGSRWVPYYAYDVLLLKDLWDIVEADPTLDPIYTEEGFWKWLQDAWGDMMEKLDQIASGSGGSGGSGSTDTRSFWDKVTDAFTSGLSALIEGVFSLITEILKTLLSLVTDMLSFLFSFIGETVLGGIGDFFSAFTDGSLLDGFQHTDETGNTATQLPEGVGAVFVDISGMISALPAELLGVLVIGIALLFLLGVIMLIV